MLKPSLLLIHSHRNPQALQPWECVHQPGEQCSASLMCMEAKQELKTQGSAATLEVAWKVSSNSEREAATPPCTRYQTAIPENETL